MVHGICPNCSYGLAELVKREVTDADVIQHFECGECGHEWASQMP